MKGGIVVKQGGQLEVSTSLEVPEPNDAQILVKTLWAAINPVDIFISDMGLLVSEWPVVPGCEGSGIVVKAGKNAKNPITGEAFKEGDEVFGCSRISAKGYSPWQEYFLMDASLTFPKPSNITMPQAATLGPAVLTAFLGVFDGLKVPLIQPSNLPAPKNEWVLVLGGAGSVGKCAVQVLKLAGYKVAATCSSKSFDLVKDIGADLPVDYKGSESDIIAAIKSATDGKLNLIIDATSYNNALATSIFDALASTTSGERLYATTNDWDPVPDASHGFATTGIALGPIGRPEATALNEKLNEYIPVVFKLLESGKMKPGDYTVQGKGFEELGKAWEYQKAGKGGSSKVLVEVAEP